METHRLVMTFICLSFIGTALVSCSSPATPESVSQSSQPLMERLTVDELAARADRIVVGEVTDMDYDRDGNGNIITLVSLSVTEVVKGTNIEEVVIAVPGGQLNDVKMSVEDTPEFQLGERVVVFLRLVDHNVFAVVGGFQGRFSIDENDMVSGNVPLTQFIDQISNIVATQ
ncbi:hypothetical protein ACFLVK_01255 [Chloroflexota bacterium]